MNCHSERRGFLQRSEESASGIDSGVAPIRPERIRPRRDGPYCHRNPLIGAEQGVNNT
jgi:hypothetical protein